ncbi:MerR family DNA-binding transcriptional regulator [Heyndrickxia acidicola]|uniref:MerR family DNA-binding transcriptional regulator n=1 Tax=Heyndrickxia acidicola TaxID=209389 RepID=A0ABU6MEZ1_9BACI|nr:MerR family DNA-binding transcriptional regulator [Heyndrickxia acidicola]MED1202957.1 MerR family DNA-binding transcriptional regulator [Heyndrickxia acidicola]
MGELAALANVSKRTIDHYTRLGLLQAKRTKSNYRLYGIDAITDLHFIEEGKRMHLPLETIRKRLELKKNILVNEEDFEQQVDHLAEQMSQLYIELSGITPVLQKLNPEQKEAITNKLAVTSTALMKSLDLLTN